MRRRHMLSLPVLLLLGFFCNVSWGLTREGVVARGSYSRYIFRNPREAGIQSEGRGRGDHAIACDVVHLGQYR